VDACDALDPESATASGVYLPLLLWIRCTNSSAALPMTKNRRAKKSWSHLDQALRATDLLLQVGGFATLARIKAMVGEDRVGTPVLEDSNRPASFHLDPFCADAASKSHTAPLERTALRRVRPPRTLEMMLAADGRPGFFRDLYDSFRVTAAYGPWRTSGAWWSVDAWDQEKWDVMARDSRGQTLCFLLVHDLLRTEWRLEALLD
jgi:hypothetical protein